VDLSALIFVALAVAWAVYLIPKALRHHEDSAASRSVEGFSARLRVLARREPVDSRSTRLVVPGRPAASVEASVEVEVEAAPVRPVPLAVRRAAARRAAQRRLRVVLVILLTGVGVGVAVALGALAPAWLAAPGGVLVAWLVLCRVMVKKERAASVPARSRPSQPAERRLPLVTEEPAEVDPETEEIVAVDVAVEVDAAPVSTTADPTPEPDPTPVAETPAGWDPVPVTLPTYVAKEPAARRSVRTIDLDSTGVWTSGRTAADSEIAREADAERKKARTAQEQAETRDERDRRASS
jgi:hypothetical protein